MRGRAGRTGHGGTSRDTKEALYSTLDALNCLDYFGRTAAYSQVLEVAAGVHATFVDAGHILGSASIFLELEEQTHSTSVLFSGDLGNAGRLLLRSPATPPHAENVVMETTYGDRLRLAFNDVLIGVIALSTLEGAQIVARLGWLDASKRHFPTALRGRVPPSGDPHRVERNGLLSFRLLASGTCENAGEASYVFTCTIRLV